MTDAAPDTARAPGFYWVRDADDWIVCWWRNGAWWEPAAELRGQSDDRFAEIGPKIEPPAAPRMAELKETLVGPPA
jgi:hypothetical protein